MLVIDFNQIAKDLNKKINSDTTWCVAGRELVGMEYGEYENALKGVFTKDSLTKALNFLCQDLMEYI